MSAIRRIAIFCCAFVLGCAASDGGPVGSGISSSISGNLITVAPSMPTSETSADLAPVAISIDEFPGATTTSDADGDFQLVGDFSGHLTLRFVAADVVATQPLEVPAGSAIVLQDVSIGAQGVHLSTARQLAFFGHIAMVDCADGTLLVDDRKAMSNQFLVRLLPRTVISPANGPPLRCADLTVGAPVGIEGVVRLNDLTVEAITITVEALPPGQPQPVQRLRFVGTVAFINCASGMLVNEGNGTIRVRLSTSTTIVNAAQQPVQCSDIMVGDQVDGVGQINIRRPGVVTATDVTVTSTAPPERLARLN